MCGSSFLIGGSNVNVYESWTFVKGRKKKVVDV